MLKKAANSKARGAFTLVELLVVIGIIAILMSVLLPSLASARRSAASIKCLSNLRNLHNAFLMYAGDFKNSTPVARQDDWDPVSRIAINQENRYWVDMIYPYLVRHSAAFPAFLTKGDADAYQKSVLWCPSWLADHSELDVWNNYSDRFKNGYGMSIYFGFTPGYPTPDAMLPANLQAVWSGVLNGGAEGKYYKRNEITSGADRVIIADSNLWVIGLKLTDVAGTISGQDFSPINFDHSTLTGGPGALNFDRYRHGKYPGVNGTTFNTTGGKVAYNALFVDGHASTLLSIGDGYRAIRMHYP